MVLDEENGRQLTAFLAAHPEFESVAMAPLLETLHAGAADRVHIGTAGGALLTPLRTGTDGFFIGVLRRR